MLREIQNCDSCDKRTSFKTCVGDAARFLSVESFERSQCGEDTTSLSNPITLTVTLITCANISVSMRQINENNVTLNPQARVVKKSL